MVMTLRPYQEAAKTAALDQWRQGFKRTLLVLPTGTGKTVVFANVIAEAVRGGGRALVLAHRDELLQQAADKLNAACDIEAAFEKAENHAFGSLLPVTVGSVQTLCKDSRLDVFPADYFDMIVVDEAHHALSDSYKKVLAHFPDANVLGVTATPDRGDRKNLADYFDSLAYEYSMRQAISDGYLCRITAQMIPLDIDISTVSLSGGDYALGGLSVALEPYLERIAAEMAAYCKNRRTVVFLPLIATSQHFRDLLLAQGFRAAEVNGESADRTETLRAFEAGEYNVLCNSMLLTEGWDCPPVDCIVVLRPTKVRALYQQMVGRGTRLYEGKQDLLLLDFLWHTARHNLCKPAGLFARTEEIQKRMEAMGDYIDLMVAEEQAESDALAEREASLAKQLKAQRLKRRKTVDPMQFMYSIAAEDLTDYEPTFWWETLPPTARQIETLERRGIDTQSVDSRGLASLLLDKLIGRQKEGLTTPKQIRLLERYGFEHVGEWSFDAASKMITRISAAGWALPHGVNPKEFNNA